MVDKPPQQRHISVKARRLRCEGFRMCFWNDAIISLDVFLVFQALQNRSTLTQKQIETKWKDLAAAIDTVYQREDRNHCQLDLSFADLYRQCYLLVKNKHGAMVYQGVEHKMRLHLRKQLTWLLQQYTTDTSYADHGNAFLRGTVHLFRRHEEDTNVIQNLCRAMDTFHVQKHPHLRDVINLGMHLFYEIVWTTVRNRIVAAWNRVIHTERVTVACLTNEDGRERDIGTCMQIMLTLTSVERTPVYQTDWEDPFLRTTRRYYRNASLMWLRGSSDHPLAYVFRVMVAYRNEVERAVAWGMLPTTQRRLHTVLQSELLEHHVDRLAVQEVQMLTLAMDPSEWKESLKGT